MALEETVVTGKRLKPKTGDEWYSFGGLRDAYTGREVISDPRNIEYDPNDPRESSPLTEEGSLIPSSDVSPQEIDITLDATDTNFSQFINQENPSFKNTYSVNDYININLLTATSEDLDVSKSDVYSILYAESSGTNNYNPAAKGDLQIQKGAFIDAKVHLGEYPYNWDNTQATKDYNNLSLDDALYYGIAYIDKIQTDFRRKNGRTPNIVETAIMYTKGTRGAQSFLGPDGWKNDSILKTYIPNVMKAYNSVEDSSPDKFAQGGTIQKTTQDFKNSLRRKDSNRFQASLREGGTIEDKGYFKETVSNIIPSGKKLLKETADMIMNPVDTAKSLYQLGSGVVQLAIPGEQKNEEVARAAGQYFADRYGSLEKAKESLKNDPIGVLTEVVGAVTGGVGLGKVAATGAGKALKALPEIDTTAMASFPAIKFKDKSNSTIPTDKNLEIGTNPVLVGGSKLKNYTYEDVLNIRETAKNSTAGTTQANKLINKEVAEGTKIATRLNLNSKIENSVGGVDKLQTLHDRTFNGKALSYMPDVTMTDIVFSVSQKGRQSIAAKVKGIDVPEAKAKHPAMSVDGKFTTKRNVLEEMGDDVIEIGIDPINQHLFIDMNTGQAVKSADIGTVIGSRVYAKGVKYHKKSEAPKPNKASDGTEISSDVRYAFNEGGTIFTGPDTSTPFTKKTSPAKIQREEDAARATEIEEMKSADKAPVQTFVTQDGVIKSKHGTGTLSGAKVIAPEDRSFLTRPTSTEPSAVLPTGSTLPKLTGKRRGIDVPSEYAAMGALGTAYGMYKLGFVGTGAAGAGGSAVAGRFVVPGPGGTLVAAPASAGASSVGAYATTGGNIAAQVIGGGATLFSLYDMYKNGVSYENVLGAVGGAATFVAGSAGAQAALGVGATGTQALAVLGPVALGLAAALVIKDMLDKPSNKTGIAYSDLSTEEFTIEGMQGAKYHPGHVDAARSLLTPTLEYVKIMEEEYSTTIGGHIQMQVGGVRGIEVIISSEDGRIYLEKDFGTGDDAVGNMYQWLDNLVTFTAETGIQDLAYASAIMNDEYMYTKGYAVEHKNKYHWYQVAGRHEGNPLGLDNTRLGEYYGMAEDRTAHNTEFEKVRLETEASILAWRDYLRTVYEDLSTTTKHITPSYRNQTFPGLRKGGTIQKPKPLARGREIRRQTLAALQAGGMVTSPWSGGSGTIYEQPSGPTPSQDVTKQQMINIFSEGGTLQNTELEETVVTGQRGKADYPGALNNPSSILAPNYQTWRNFQNIPTYMMDSARKPPEGFSEEEGTQTVVRGIDRGLDRTYDLRLDLAQRYNDDRFLDYTLVSSDEIRKLHGDFLARAALQEGTLPDLAKDLKTEQQVEDDTTLDYDEFKKYELAKATYGDEFEETMKEVEDNKFEKKPAGIILKKIKEILNTDTDQISEKTIDKYNSFMTLLKTDYPELYENNTILISNKKGMPYSKDDKIGLYQSPYTYPNKDIENLYDIKGNMYPSISFKEIDKQINLAFRFNIKDDVNLVNSLDNWLNTYIENNLINITT